MDPEAPLAPAGDSDLKGNVAKPTELPAELGSPGRRPWSALFGGLTPAEWRTLGPLCFVYGLRLLGMYMVLPVLSVYARRLEGSTAFLTGMSIGAYGFTNMLIVLPFGILSDRIGRKRTIAIGLGMFALGSFVAAWGPGIVWLLVGRALQGAGAVSSVVVALVGDITRPKVRGRAMALLGASVEMAFVVGVIVGPALAGEFGVPVLFLLTGILSLVSLALVLLTVREPAHVRHDDEHDAHLRDVRPVLHDLQLVKLDAGMFLAHFALTSLFVVLPILLDRLIPPYHLWRVYTPVVLLGMAIMLPTMIYAEKMRAVDKMLLAGIGLFGASFVLFYLFSDSLPGLFLAMAVFVISGGLLEPTLSTLLTRYTTRETRGTAAGIFNASGFLGAFLGGAVGGLLLESHRDLFLALAAASALWLVAALRTAPEPATVAARRG